MNGAQLHLALNHVPVVLSLVAFFVMFWGALNRNAEIKSVGLSLAVATAVFAGFAFWTGEPAEHVLRDFPQFSKELVHEHEEAGETVFIVSILSGCLALAAAWFAHKKNRFAAHALWACLILTGVSSAGFLRTAHLGGLIRHEEIRPNGAH